MLPCYIFDIDGTLADNSHRTHLLASSPKDWDSYFKLSHLDKPHKHICDLAKKLDCEASPVVFLSGRHSGEMAVTAAWLRLHVLDKPFSLFMRREGDFRPDYVIKLELLAEVRAAGMEPIMCFDDRDSVVKMWRDAGVPCAQVAPGAF
jgi:hypothetical protein